MTIKYLKITLICMAVTQALMGSLQPIKPLGENSSKRSPLFLYAHNDKSYDSIAHKLKNFDLDYKEIFSLDPQDKKHLHIIVNNKALLSKDLPQYYILVQLYALEDAYVDNDTLIKLKNAVAVWDGNWNNIKKYKSHISHYYYFAHNYEYIDPVLLACYLPLELLDIYKTVLSYSNEFNTDISSHLPTLFVQCVTQKPRAIVEAGVRGGEGSTVVFKKIAEYCTTKIIGIDIDNSCQSLYNNVKNTQFICMDDTTFAEYYKKNAELNKTPLDIIFIDTSHLYDHTLAEIKGFASVLADNGLLIFHDSNMSPLNDLHSWYCLNGDVYGTGGWDNKKGVARAIKDYFNIRFDETKYNNFTFSLNGVQWQLVHYPFCNGLTITKKCSNK